MLARRHPEARRVLERRREELAASIAKGKGAEDPAVCRKLAHFDSILNQEGRTLEVYRTALAREESQDCAPEWLLDEAEKLASPRNSRSYVSS